MRAERRQLRGRLANATARANASKDPSDQAHVLELRRDYVAESLADHIAAVVATAPPLTDHQIARLRALLDGGGRDG